MTDVIDPAQAPADTSQRQERNGQIAVLVIGVIIIGLTSLFLDGATGGSWDILPTLTIVSLLAISGITLWLGYKRENDSIIIGGVALATLTIIIAGIFAIITGNNASAAGIIKIFTDDNLVLSPSGALLFATAAAALIGWWADSKNWKYISGALALVTVLSFMQILNGLAANWPENLVPDTAFEWFQENKVALGGCLLGLIIVGSLISQAFQGYGLGTRIMVFITVGGLLAYFIPEQMIGEDATKKFYKDLGNKIFSVTPTGSTSAGTKVKTVRIPTTNGLPFAIWSTLPTLDYGKHIISVSPRNCVVIQHFDRNKWFDGYAVNGFDTPETFVRPLHSKKFARENGQRQFSHVAYCSYGETTKVAIEIS